MSARCFSRSSPSIAHEDDQYAPRSESPLSREVGPKARFVFRLGRWRISSRYTTGLARRTTSATDTQRWLDEITTSVVTGH